MEMMEEKSTVLLARVRTGNVKTELTSYPVSFVSEQRFSNLTVLGNLLGFLKTERCLGATPQRF